MQKTIKILTTIGAAGLLSAGVGFAQEGGKVDFEKQVYPFIKTGCVKCHRPPYTEDGRARRPKADLIITNKADFLKGGETGEIVVAGKPLDSTFYTRTLLPLCDDEHMPPEGKADQWTDEQKDLFKKWVEQGADFGAWMEDPEFKE
jgi:hypothetical protein